MISHYNVFGVLRGWTFDGTKETASYEPAYTLNYSKKSAYNSGTGVFRIECIQQCTVLFSERNDRPQAVIKKWNIGDYFDIYYNNDAQNGTLILIY